MRSGRSADAHRLDALAGRGQSAQVRRPGRIGPNQLLVIAHVVPHDGAADLVDNVEDLRKKLVDLPVVSRAEVTPVRAS